MRLLFALLCCTTALPLQAQWRFSLMAGPSATTGHSRDDADPEQPAILPDHPVNWTLGVAHPVGAWRIAFEGHRITSDLAIRGSTTSLVTRSAISAWGLGGELSRRVTADATGPTVLAGAGAVYERWSFDIAGGDPRWRAAVRGSLELDVPLARRWSGIVRGEWLAGGSLFRHDELPAGYARRAGYRAGLLLGVTLAENRR